MPYWEIEDILQISKRTYYQYCRELWECQNILTMSGQEVLYNAAENPAKSVYDKHIEKLRRLISMMDYINTLPSSPYAIPFSFYKGRKLLW